MGIIKWDLGEIHSNTLFPVSVLLMAAYTLSL